MRCSRTHLLLTVLAALLVPLAGLTPASSTVCAKPTYVHAFHVEAEWTKKIYRRSEKAEVTVTVTRPAHEDPADLGIELDPPVPVPVEGVTVTTAVKTGSYPYPYGYGQSDAQGQVHFKIPLKKLEPGEWDVSHLAEKWTNQGACPDFNEWGYLYDSPAFTVTRG